MINGVGLAMQPDIVPALNTALDRTMQAFEPWSTGVDYLNFADRPSDGVEGLRRRRPRSRLLEVKARGPERAVPGGPPGRLTRERRAAP